MKTVFRALLIAAITVVAAACAKKAVKDEAPPPPPPAPEQAPVVDTGLYTPEDLDTDSCLRQRQVYFDFDKDNLKPEFEAIVACHGKYLRDRPSARITLEGNADERGTREYNLGLGERRGNTINTALMGAGGSAGQLTVVSYGEERPTCTESNEDCWSKNRRVEIVYTAK